jgi:outer membrane protein assembly factor BamE (lipoprotein component of BamABCDE complex)
MGYQIARRISSFIFLVALVALLGGCLVSATSNEKRSGNYVPESTFSQIEPGKTSAGWVEATLGQPSSKNKVEATDSEIWKYSYTERKDSSGAVFLLFGGHDSKETTGHAFVEIKDGVVVHKWRG